jgi:pyridine nucleotide-disulfide oxidoreductase family protein
MNNSVMEGGVNRLILVGGGHAHVHVLKKLRTKKPRGLKVLMVSSDTRQYYSGMAAGYIEGRYDLEDYTFDLPELCERSGVQFIQDEVIHIDSKGKNLTTSSGRSIPYDRLSVDTGSELKNKRIPGVIENALMIKPFRNLTKLKQIIQSGSYDAKNIVIIGGGAAGVELACAIAYAVQNHRISPPSHITMIDGGQDIMQNYPDKARFHARQALKKAGVALVLGTRVAQVGAHTVTLDSGNSIRHDLAIWATGTQSHPLYSASGLPTDEQDYLRVDETLRCISEKTIWGAGDCIAFGQLNELPKNGVQAIREAPILAHNLFSNLASGKYRIYRPKKRYLAIISLGGGLGLLTYGNIVLTGKNLWLLKDWIDRSYIRNSRR